MVTPTSGDPIAIIALTTFLGFEVGETALVSPLTHKEWHRLALWLDRVKMRLGELRELDGGARSDLAGVDPSFPTRIEALLRRCDRAGKAVRELEDRGIWIATIGGAGYPGQWLRKFGLAAPPLVYGDGSPANVDHPAIGIVGSRDVSESLAGVANDLGAKAVLGEYSVVSGGARGTDRIGMNGALAVGGSVVGILPDHLQRERLRRPNRDAIDSGRLTLISVVHPDTPFDVGNAMYRNRLIYALSDLTIVVSTSEGTGGTWAGATENLKRRWAPIAVWTGAFAPDANKRLVERGAVALTAVPGSSTDVQKLVRDASVAFEANAAQVTKPVNLTLEIFGSE